MKTISVASSLVSSHLKLASCASYWRALKNTAHENCVAIKHSTSLIKKKKYVKYFHSNWKKCPFIHAGGFFSSSVNIYLCSWWEFGNTGWENSRGGRFRWGKGDYKRILRFMKRENLHTLPLVHKLVGERIAGLTLHNVWFSCFIGKRNGWDLSWPAQDKRQTRKTDKISDTQGVNSGGTTLKWWLLWHARQVKHTKAGLDQECQAPRNHAHWTRLDTTPLRLRNGICVTWPHWTCDLTPRDHDPSNLAPLMNTAKVVRFERLRVSSFYTLSLQWQDESWGAICQDQMISLA